MPFHELDQSKTVGLIPSNYGFTANDVQSFSYKFTLLDTKIHEYTDLIRANILGCPKLIVDLELADQQKAAEEAAKKLHQGAGQLAVPPRKRTRGAS